MTIVARKVHIWDPEIIQVPGPGGSVSNPAAGPGERGEDLFFIIIIFQSPQKGARPEGFETGGRSRPEAGTAPGGV